MRLERPPALNDDPVFIATLAELVRAKRCAVAWRGPAPREGRRRGGAESRGSRPRAGSRRWLPKRRSSLVERSPRSAGRSRTERIGGFVIEAAPDSFLSRKERGVGLCEELGLGGELVGRRPENAPHASSAAGQSCSPLPEGLTGMIPTNLDALERSALLSEEGRARFSAEPDVPVAPRRRGRVGRVVRLASLRAGGVRGAHRAAHDGDLRRRRRAALAAGDVPTAARARARARERASRRSRPRSPHPQSRPPFVSLATGMDVLVTALVVPPRAHESSSRAAAAHVCAERRTATSVELGDGERFAPTVSSSRRPRSSTARAPRPSSTPSSRTLHAEIPYASSVRRHARVLARTRSRRSTATATWSRAPRARDVLACTWTSQKWEGRAPEGSALAPRLRRAGSAAATSRAETDDELVALARDELRAARHRRRADAHPRPALAARDAAVRPRPSWAARADRALALESIRARARGRRVPRGRHPRLHRVGRGGGRVRRAGARRVPGCEPGRIGARSSPRR